MKLSRTPAHNAPDIDHERPLVSIVTPSFNQAEFIEQTIESVRDQDYPNIQHIVIDGGSSDGTIEILKRHPQLEWLSEPDEGQSEAINKGFKRAKGEIIGWLNADDVYYPGAIREAVEYLESHPEAALVYGDFIEVEVDGRERAPVRTVAFDLNRMLNQGNLIPQPSTLFRRVVLDRVGYLNPEYHYAMDYDYWIRIAKCGLRLDHVDRCWSGFRLHRTSKTVSQSSKAWREHRRIARANGGRFLVPALYGYRRVAYLRLANSRVRPLGMRVNRVLRKLGLKGFHG
jgi:glycosyltransferase involved in cell wall biosynthesis